MVLETYVRIFTGHQALNDTRAFYRTLLNGQDGLRFSYPEKGLELAAVISSTVSVLIIAGAPDARAPFEATQLTIRVDDIESACRQLTAEGAEQLEPVQSTPVGAKTRFQHPDGMVVEYVVNHDTDSSG
ncbi:VOC family protein [Salinisphaera sp. SPP-AMP-43]|uniref:VOC family protein n=1 Tax=Salinisphaera sp. SPP-AMP-43 TaxID=3121288 RepID=UPI003C6E551E